MQCPTIPRSNFPFFCVDQSYVLGIWGHRHRMMVDVGLWLTFPPTWWGPPAKVAVSTINAVYRSLIVFVHLRNMALLLKYDGQLLPASGCHWILGAHLPLSGLAFGLAGCPHTLNWTKSAGLSVQLPTVQPWDRLHWTTCYEWQAKAKPDSLVEHFI